MITDRSNTYAGKRLVLPHPCQQIVLQEAIQTIIERIKRQQRLDIGLEYQVKLWRYDLVVKVELGDY